MKGLTQEIVGSVQGTTKKADHRVPGFTLYVISKNSIKNYSSITLIFDFFKCLNINY